jgi:ParB family transcriptional regulator, chromosome partitioning protein
VVHALASRILLGTPATDTSLQITALQQPFRNLKDSLALNYIQSERHTWGSVIPGTPAALWTWCLEQDQTRLLDLLAFCTATTIDAVQTKADRPGAPRLENSKALAEAVHLDMLKWFFPASDNYFSRISKPQILEALREARGTAPAPAWEKLKKAELAILAEQEITGKNWLPEPLRRQ